jgi:hypothetical protein
VPFSAVNVCYRFFASREGLFMFLSSASKHPLAHPDDVGSLRRLVGPNVQSLFNNEKEYSIVTTSTGFPSDVLLVADVNMNLKHVVQIGISELGLQ